MSLSTSGRVLVGEKVHIMPVSQHDSFPFRVGDGYQARCQCGVNGLVHESGALEKCRKAASAEASAHNREAEYK